MMENRGFRKSLRLPGYDYSQAGSYFVTFVTQHRERLFGWVIAGEMKLNDAGRMVDQVCQEIPRFIPGIRLECYQIMPDHIHLIIEIVSLGENNDCRDVGATLSGCPGQTQRSVPTDLPDKFLDESNNAPAGERTGETVHLGGNRISLPNVVARFKSLTTRRYIAGVQLYHWPRFEKRLWQRNYYEHVIRDVHEHQRIIDYIQANPSNWEK